MMKEKRPFQPLSPERICQIYNLLHKEGYFNFPLTTQSFAKVDAIVSNVLGSSYGTERYSSNEEKVIAHLYFLIKDHPFTDGNKRTATIVFLVLCELNSLAIVLPEGISLDSLVLGLEEFQTPEHQVLIKALALGILTQK